MDINKALELWNVVSQLLVICISGYAAAQSFTKSIKVQGLIARKARGVVHGRRVENIGGWYLVRLLIIIIVISIPIEFVLFSHGQWTDFNFIRLMAIPTIGIVAGAVTFLITSRLFFAWWYQAYPRRQGLRGVPSARYARVNKLLAVGAVIAVFYHLIRWLMVVQKQGWM